MLCVIIVGREACEDKLLPLHCRTEVLADIPISCQIFWMLLPLLHSSSKENIKTKLSWKLKGPEFVCYTFLSCGCIWCKKLVLRILHSSGLISGEPVKTSWVTNAISNESINLNQKKKKQTKNNNNSLWLNERFYKLKNSIGKQQLHMFIIGHLSLFFFSLVCLSVKVENINKIV